MLKELSLDGTWKAAWFDGQRGCYQGKIDTAEARLAGYIDAKVPGEIHLDLVREGIIKDPAVEGNCLSARWVEECVWIYRREFDVPAEALKGRSWLAFGELDYAASVTLNGELLGTHANYFTPCRFETTGKLKKGSNLLVIHLEGGLFSVSEKPTEGYGLSLDAKLHKRHWLRKPQSEFAWDWSPRLINVGIGKHCALEWTSEPFRLGQFAPNVALDESLKKAKARARLFLEGLSGKPEKCRLEAEIPELGVKAKGDFELKADGTETACDLSFDVEGFELWNPRGYGAQKLYDIEIKAFSGSKLIGSRKAATGFRKVEFVREPHPEAGNRFRLEINGRKIFVKGANFVPADFIFSRIDKTKYEKLIERAEELGFNMVRIWGGGLYEADELYELCDRRGFVVWQEFCFSCTRYPAHDPEFMKSVIEEATFHVRRLAGRASLVAWCGSNETQMHQTSRGAWTNGVVLPDYGLFHKVLPAIIAVEDFGRYYQPSSPYSDDITKYSNDDETGDQHPWGVGFSNNDFRDYRKMRCRFPCEGGVLGPTALPTMLACLPEGQRQRDSFAWTVHDNSIAPAFWVKPHVDNIGKLWLDKDFSEMSVAEYVYWGGILQGEGLREYCENFRRRMFYDSASAVFWMYNDCWPTVRSWTVVDYYLRRTPSFHFVRRAMNPVHVVVVENKESSRCEIYGVNDSSKSVKASLRFGIFSLSGEFSSDETKAVSLPAGASTLLASFASKEWRRRESEMPFAMLLDARGALIARNRLFDKLFKEMKWPKAKVSVKLEKGVAVFSSSSFALDVCIDLDGEKDLADNFFDVWPGIPYSIPWRGKSVPEIKFVGNLR